MKNELNVLKRIILNLRGESDKVPSAYE